METIEVSPEMLTLVGLGALGDHRWPPRPVAFEIGFGNPATFRFHKKVSRRALMCRDDEVRLILEQYQDEMQRAGASYQEMFKKVKNELVRKYKAVL